VKLSPEQGRRVRLLAFAGILASWLAIGLGGVSTGAAEADRLERFRQLASRLSVLDLSGSESAAELFREMYALLDDEILESLEAGSVFASKGFLQERLDAFNEAWGGSAFWILNLPTGDVKVGSFQLFPGAWGNSVRVYGRVGGRAQLLAAIHREGIPQVFAFPPAGIGQGQFLAVWVGPPSPRGTPVIQIELWRQEGDRLRAVWSTANLLGPDLYATAWEVRGQEISVRYEVRYPGWTPGCEGQTEQEDHYRYVPASETFLLARRRVHNGWHRELHATVDRLLAALEQRDQRMLSTLGLTQQLQRELPDRLEPEPACDILDGPSPQVVTVSATTPGDPRPWALRFQYTQNGWRLAGSERLP